MYVRTSFRGTETSKTGKKVFLVIVTNFGKDMTYEKLKSTCLGCVLKVRLQG